MVLLSNNKELWPGWETVGVIGKGQFGHVYKIRKKDDHIGNEFYSALKVIVIPSSESDHQAYVDDGYDHDSITNLYADQVNRIVDEFSLLYKFKGTANIVSYEDHMVLHSDDRLSWKILIRMELLNSLPEYVRTHGMDEDEVIRFGIDICRALELCQTQNIIHRDIKPQNIFVNDFGSFKLGDFGIARTMDHTTHATLAGTMSYMAPEIFRRESYNSTVDIYSLGLVMYWLMNERRMPFLPLPPELPSMRQSEEALMRRYNGEELPPPRNASEMLVKIILKACQYTPGERYASPAQMRAALEALNSMPVSAVKPPKDTRNIHTSFLIGGTALLTVLVLLLLLRNCETDRNRETQDSDMIPTGGQIVDDIRSDSTDSTDIQTDTQMLPEAITEVQTEAAVEETTALPEETGAAVETEAAKIMVVSVTVAANPKVTQYTVGDKLNTDGLVLKVKYSDDSQKNISSGFTCSPKTLTTVGNVRISVSYSGKTTAFTVNVAEKTVETEKPAETAPVIVLTGLSVAELPKKTEYEVGETFDTTGLVLLAQYSDGSTKRVTQGFTCGQPDMSKASLYNVEVAYQGKKTKFEIIVKKLPEVISPVVIAQGDCGASVTWELWDSGILEIAGNGEMDNYNHYSEVPWSEYLTKIKKVVIHDGVTLLGRRSFIYCTNLKDISIPKSVTEIEGSAFENCTSLTTVTIPDSVTSIGDDVFRDCTSLTTVTIPESVIYIGAYVFEGCTSLTKVTIPKSVTYISKCAFNRCTSLTSVTIRGSVKNIEASAFNNCTSLTSITLPESVTGIEFKAFFGCTSLKTITIPDSVTSIGNDVFSDCTSLTTVTIPDSVTSMGNNVFSGCTSLTTVTIPDSVTSIGSGAFSNCTSLKTITIPNSLTYISNDMFSGCTSLTKVTIPDAVIQIWHRVFSGCTSLKTITIPKSVTDIGSNVFSGWTNKQRIIIKGRSSVPDEWYEKGNWNSGCDAEIIFEP